MSKNEAAMQEVSKEDVEKLSAGKKPLFVEKTVKEEVEKTPNRIVGVSWPANVEIKISGSEFNELLKVIKIFEVPVAIINNIQNKLLDLGEAKVYYPEDLNKDYTLREDFWTNPDKYKFID